MGNILLYCYLSNIPANTVRYASYAKIDRKHNFVIIILPQFLQTIN